MRYISYFGLWSSDAFFVFKFAHIIKAVEGLNSRVAEMARKLFGMHP